MAPHLETARGFPLKPAGMTDGGLHRTLLSCLFSVCHWYEDEWYEDGHNEVRNLVIPTLPSRHSRLATLVIPGLSILSFPPVFSGNPVSFSSVLSFVWPPTWEQPVDSRLKMSGMTEGD